MPLQDYRDTLLQCLSTLNAFNTRPQEFSRFRWRAIYMTRSRFCYFFRGRFNGIDVSAEAQQMDLHTGVVTNIPWTSAPLYGATFALNEAVTVYDGRLKSVIEVAHAFSENDEHRFEPEFFYVKTDLSYISDDWRPGFVADPRLHKNTNLIFVGFEDGNAAGQLENTRLASWMSNRKPIASADWYAERYYYE
ncbi:hypothetical protein [Oryzifoliimicrobium ureilyticus]|uniref:hypothetical protein n=1 Tax=Oryzifoliimicrobium ureilyticus TaxID=3113724 RepID=UPI003076568B